ncbi:MarR family winged helix-turn-helix transcriptional regulator [Glycomyces tenuis]|uniref:MarR family winged helix-turn-helix transcriptional regulator n=1 Tax=Glycomyces tenuis TaxID=58116 RepID=UPI00041AD222|nr:MarR family transcriptional regulator [Glycomyces tenuis]
MTEASNEFFATMYVFAERLRDDYETAAAAADLTASQAIVIGLLSEPLPMGDLAAQRHCDPSNITGLVDRLEDKGLVARSPHPTDRRVKRVELTPEGRRRLARFHEELSRVSCLNDLTADQRRRLLTSVPSLEPETTDR